MADKPKRPRDMNQLAKAIVDAATSPQVAEVESDTSTQREAGRKGGKARAEALSAKVRREIAQKAAASRWKDIDG